MIAGAVTIGFLHPGHYSAAFAESLKGALVADIFGEQRIISHNFGQIAKQCGTSGIVAGRNQLARVMCDESEAEWLFMVDSDMGFADDTIERLIAAADPTSRPMVGALCFAHKADGKASNHGMRYKALPTVYDWYEDPHKVGFLAREDYAKDSLLVVGATGGACTLIHRTVFERVRNKYGDVWFSPVTHPTGSTEFSEDLSFCVRVSGCDIPIYVHTGIKTTHDKSGVFLDEEFYDHQQFLAKSLAPTIPEQEILLIIPSRGRPQQAHELVESWKEWGEGRSHIVFCLDDDDPTRFDYPSESHGVSVEIGPRQRLVAWTNEVAMQYRDLYKVFGSVGDDHRFESAWESPILRAVAIMDTVGIVYGDDGFQHEKLPTACFVSANIVKLLGFMAPPVLEHLFCDNFWLMLGQDSGCLRYLPEVKITHYNPIATHGNVADALADPGWDATYAEANTNEKYLADQSAFDTWWRAEGQQAADAVRALRSFLAAQRAGVGRPIHLGASVPDQPPKPNRAQRRAQEKQRR